MQVMAPERAIEGFRAEFEAMWEHGGAVDRGLAPVRERAAGALEGGREADRAHAGQGRGVVRSAGGDRGPRPALHRRRDLHAPRRSPALLPRARLRYPLSERRRTAALRSHRLARPVAERARSWQTAVRSRAARPPRSSDQPRTSCSGGNEMQSGLAFDRPMHRVRACLWPSMAGTPAMAIMGAGEREQAPPATSTRRARRRSSGRTGRR